MKTFLQVSVASLIAFSFSGAVLAQSQNANVCARSSLIRDALEAALYKPCAEITDSDLSSLRVLKALKSVPHSDDRNGKPTAEEVIRLGAYLNWESAGKPAGDGINFWLEVEKDVLPQK